jgi:hypothetical protein
MSQFIINCLTGAIIEDLNYVPPIELIREPTLSELKRIGKFYNGVMVPLDKDAQDTIVAITVQVLAGVFTGTIAEFSNGTKMTLTPSNFMDFAKWFGVERNRFFV